MAKAELIEQAKQVLTEAGYHVGDPLPPRAIFRCFKCGISDQEDYLFTIRVLTNEGEEGHADVLRYVCDEHQIEIHESLIAMGFGTHVHGGICFLEITECPGHEDMKACPTPEPQYPGMDD